ncbi:alpha/beta hydrolase [Campylobacter upsaliensis]|uniref:Alpha/beta hydrolase n=1 Tax=Campylobacter upsaliensis TaxID=28080 RepID=A0A5L8T8N3_CAMUP|nr:alpha/beta hydrolase [Campylobacter upsaliensis]EAH5199647.1 alpha/beta hydrolase [Campylobacter upsaliensis]EAI2893624.1 alpha/beta hydrolase [Campylobacter upsaliensis]EAI4455861.1 alpha/beta hydrolase [Campylobacter upsaliensis]EAI6142895.1 alpha/beta hydrolase [Campylobacter upsaliensis]
MKIGQNRRKFLQKVGIGAGALLIGDTLLAKESSPKAQSPSAQKFREEKLNLSTKWDKTFPKSSKVLHQKVTFHNRYRITLAADLYLPKNLSKDSKLPAIALSGPFGAVKEQSSGLYAQTLAENGFITLAFDPSFTGESGGLPRFVASPDINTEDFSAALDFLSLYPNVDSSKIGIVGICGFGGFAINAAANDPRIKATLASTMYDMTRVYANGYFDKENSKEARNKKRKELADQRIKDYKGGVYALAGGVIDPLPNDAPEFVKDYHSYYKTPRAYHKRSLASNGGWNRTSMLSFLNMPILTYSDEIENAVLLIHGEKAHSRYFSEDVYKKLKGKNKELFIVKNASHTDLYDKVDIIPFAKITAFFKQYLV